MISLIDFFNLYGTNEEKAYHIIHHIIYTKITNDIDVNDIAYEIKNTL